MNRKCCAECFGDRALRKEIIPLRATGLGRCSYCGAEGVNLVEPRGLADLFEVVTGIYRPGNSGKTLVEWLREDWGMFPKLDDAHAKELLADILDDGAVVRKPFKPSELCQTDRLIKWRGLRRELMYENRFFPREELDRDRLTELLSQLIIDREELPNVWYRARIQDGSTPFEIGQMGAPPNRNTSHGRANPAGIPYLYLGSLPETAVAELRPHTGEAACVADFTIRADLNIVDLRFPRKQVSPFIFSDETQIALLRGDVEFLEELGDELTIPVLPQSAAIDYVPSEYLCEFIKLCMYDGVIYRSSVSEGMNLALFNPAHATGKNVRQYAVARVSVEIRTC